MQCPNCGVDNPPGSLYCRECGGDMGPVARGEVPPEAPPANPQPVPGPYLPQPPYYVPGQVFYPQQRTDGMCVAALVLGIVSIVLSCFPFICQICGVLAITFGGLGIRNVQQDPYLKTGSAMGKAGLITGIIGLVGGTILIVVIVASGPS
jgi:hypothetical protein